MSQLLSVRKLCNHASTKSVEYVALNVIMDVEHRSSLPTNLTVARWICLLALIDLSTH